MNTAKMLPWLAKTAGIELDRAEQLWNSASDSAQCATGESQGIRYLSAAHDRMVNLVEKEVLAANPVAEAPWLMIQAHLGIMPMIVANHLAQVSADKRYAPCGPN